jgi:hypothetical protein
VVVDDPAKLNETLANLGVQESQLSAFRQILASLCPEQDVHGQVMDEKAFPLSGATPVPLIVGALEALLDNSANFQGICLPQG